MDEKQLTDSQWEETYKPIANHISNSGTMFETFGEEWEFIRLQDPHHVWTWVDAELSTVLVAGVAFVNRIGYYVCENPWEDQDLYVVVSEDKECVCYKACVCYNEDEDVVDTREGQYGDPECKLCKGYGYVTEYS